MLRGAGDLLLAALLALAASGCSREPQRAAPTDAGAAPPGPSMSDAGDAGGAADAGDAGDAVHAAVDRDPLPEAERRAIAGWISFVSERDGNPEIYLTRPSGEEERRLTQTPAAEYPVAADPDGAALLLVAVDEDAEHKLHLEQIVVQPLDGGPAKAIGPRGGRDRNPSFSPDGRWVVFESDSESFSDIYRVGRDGSGLRRLTRNNEGNFEPALSADGSQIAFVTSRDGDPEVYRMRSDGTGQQRLTAFHREDWGPRWSPDGKRLAFLSDREGRQRIYLMNADGTQLRPLTSQTPEPPAPAAPPDGAAAPPAQPRLPDEFEPVWSPDGTRLSYITRGAGTRARIWVTDATSGASTALTSGEHSDEAPTWSPDGRYLAFSSNRAGDPEIYLMRADGTGQTRLTRAKGSDWLPRWIPPGRKPQR